MPFDLYYCCKSLQHDRLIVRYGNDLGQSKIDQNRGREVYNIHKTSDAVDNISSFDIALGKAYQITCELNLVQVKKKGVVMSNISTERFFLHSCNQCTYLGSTDLKNLRNPTSCMYDLYYCWANNGSEIIARFGNGPANINVGLVRGRESYFEVVPERHQPISARSLGIAYRLAFEAGLIKKGD